MRTLIYKRTHTGDPDQEGRFGIHDCMGRVRRWPFDAVIGVGGVGAEPERHRLAGKVNWIGVGPHKGEAGKRGPIITFEHFHLYKSGGPSFEKLAPKLADRMYSKNVRVVMNSLDQEEQREVEKILALARRFPPSPARSSGRPTTSPTCSPKTPSQKSIKGCSS